MFGLNNYLLHTFTVRHTLLPDVMRTMEMGKLLRISKQKILF
jgi:hypothetical protein